MDKLESLYNWSDEMSKAGVDFSKHEQDYAKMVEYVKSSNTKESILAAQLVARFFKNYPNYADTALTSILDLCKSTDVDVRKHATMSLVTICRVKTDFVDKAADILIQLYQSDQLSEVNLVNSSLMTLLNLDIKKFLSSFFARIEDGSEIVRERALKFLSTRIQTLSAELLTKEVEEQIMTLSKKAMEDVTKDEFIYFVGILSKLKIAKTVQGQQLILESIKAQAELDKDLDVNDSDAIDKFLMCTKNSIPLLTQYNRASAYVNYICLKILPNLSVLSAQGTDLQVLQALAEMSPFIVAQDNPAIIDLEKCQQSVYNKLLDYLPIPSSQPVLDQTVTAATTNPAEITDDKKQADGDSSNLSNNGGSTATAVPKPSSEPDFQFTHIEYLLYTIHQLCRVRPEFFTETLQNDTRLRLHHLAVGCTKYMELLSNLLKGVKSSEDLKKEENKLRNVALRTTKNISTMVKDLFKKPPQFKTSVLLSCKPLTSRPVDVNDEKKPSSGDGKHHHQQSVVSSHKNNNSGRKPHNSNNNNNGGQKYKFRPYYNQPSNKRRRY